jgi:type VI secretion system secreted protein VgrG
VYWQVGSSATIGTGSVFVGKILALTSITLNGGTLRGKSLARNGAISMSAQEMVDGPPCGNGTAISQD